MAMIVDVTEAEVRFSELLARVEAGEEIIIMRDDDPVAHFVTINERGRRLVAIEGLRAARSQAKPVTQDEIQAWKCEGRR